MTFSPTMIMNEFLCDQSDVECLNLSSETGSDISHIIILIP